ncbi:MULTISPECIES: hypothetical protein [Brucella]|uniref:hypothetical protein n=1 Tax=Brucella TaxID=234 RepID=UPI0001B59846|nr:MULTISPECIES: hypothetical protein [Brucella]ADZ67611.1 conserved hypothetical protein [Brucella melitensis M28]ADZ88477.1 conserved hypothetical protein [Brucella melitensis M5-90]AEQ10064.1 hypothetical protein BMNI_II0354 [Brucella melitensis NI]AIJ55918.1 hypothetical protein DK51_2275 [Brucella abortus]AIJ87733.1 hypothetical protein DK63_2371 [Brucella melitensis bv. 1 str. 16M]AIJ94817.1 hypothetical protein DK61_2883 [Brucella melitensis bv. 2 str. 63/9]ENP33733.1 hypothetical pro
MTDKTALGILNTFGKQEHDNMVGVRHVDDRFSEEDTSQSNAYNLPRYRSG